MGNIINGSALYLISADDLREFALSLIEEAKGMERNATPSELITIKQACELLQCDKASLWRWEKKGLIKGYRVGKSVRYNKPELLRAFEIGKEA
jgi:excisionase family DNA binding protein